MLNKGVNLLLVTVVVDIIDDAPNLYKLHEANEHGISVNKSVDE